MKKLSTLILVVLLIVTMAVCLVACDSSEILTKDVEPTIAMEKYVARVNLEERYKYLESKISVVDSEGNDTLEIQYIFQEGAVYLKVDDLRTEGKDTEIWVKNENNKWMMYGRSINSDGITSKELVIGDVPVWETEIDAETGETVYKLDADGNKIPVMDEETGVQKVEKVDEYTAFTDRCYGELFGNILPSNVGQIVSAKKGPAELIISFKNASEEQCLLTINHLTNKVHGFVIQSADGSIKTITYRYPIQGFNKTDIPAIG